MGIPGITVFCSIVSWFHRLLFRFLLGKSSGVAFAPVAMAPPGTGTGGGCSAAAAAAAPSRTFRGEGTRLRCRGARGTRPLTRRAAAAARDAQRGRREGAAGAGRGRRGRAAIGPGRRGLRERRPPIGGAAVLPEARRDWPNR